METVSLTYVELAERLHVQPESARKTTQRRKWRKYKGNDGLTRVEVPLEDLPPPDPPPFVPGPTPGEQLAGLKEVQARLEAECAMLRQMLSRSDLALEDHKAMIERWQTESMKWQEQAAQWQGELNRMRLATSLPRSLFRFWRRSNGNGN
jgi:hypothetical protein